VQTGRRQLCRTLLFPVQLVSCGVARPQTCWSICRAVGCQLPPTPSSVSVAGCWLRATNRSISCGSFTGTLGQQAMQLGPSFCETAACGPQANAWQPSWAARGGQPLRLDVRHTPLGSGTEWGAPPVSCPSRLQHSSPARDGSGACLFDPFASSQDDPPGLTPLGAQQAAAAPRAAPPAVQRKPAAECSPGPALPPPPAAPSFAGRVQSCPPERLGRRGARPLVRLRCV
jgi:hypothetical protein